MIDGCERNGGDNAAALVIALQAIEELSSYI
jgi:hypothetical protein